MTRLRRGRQRELNHGTTRKSTETANTKYIGSLFSIRVIPWKSVVKNITSSFQKGNER
jgi:hypothetical protein